MTLNGFLALDAIFLGNINLDRINSDILTLDLTGRYSPTPRWQFELSAPLVARSSSYFSEVEQRQGAKLGDVSFAIAYKAVQENNDWPESSSRCAPRHQPA